MNNDTSTLVVVSPTAASVPDQTIPAIATPAPTRQRAEQSQSIANDLAEGSRLVQTALTKPAAAEALAAIGYGPEELARGQALAETAQAKFAARQFALVRSLQSRVDRDAAFEVAKDDFASYRVVVRANYGSQARSKLGASDRISKDKEKFLVNVRSAYASARQDPHGGVLARFGFTESRFTAIEATLAKFAAKDAEFKEADRAAAQATLERDAAAAELGKWVGTYSKLAKIAFRRRPEMLSALDLK